MYNRLSPEVIQKIKYIEVNTRRILKGNLAGERIIPQRGFGLEFDQIREYQPGDDVRFIDWKSTARTGKVLVKQYYQERSRTVWLAVDISWSQNFSSGATSKRDLAAQVASVLSIVADAQKDHIGLILFAGDVEHCILPKRGRAHVHEIMKQLFSYQSQSSTTSIENVCKYFAQRRFKDALIFLISDFIDDGFEKPLAYVAQKFDVVAIRSVDDVEHHFPEVGALAFQDLETGVVCDIDGASQRGLSTIIARHVEHQNGLFKKYGIDYINVRSSQPFMSDLIHFFKRRASY